MSKREELFEHIFKNGIRVEVTNHGVTLWDIKARRWIVDASTIEADNNFEVSQIIFDKMKQKSNPCFPAHYKKPRKKLSSKGESGR